MPSLYIYIYIYMHPLPMSHNGDVGTLSWHGNCLYMLYGSLWTITYPLCPSVFLKTRRKKLLAPK